jgi:vacuolar-type H+-ATPase subunit E/Vma4
MEAEQVVEKILSEARKEAQAIDGQSQQQLVHEQQKLEHS